MARLVGSVVFISLLVGPANAVRAEEETEAAEGASQPTSMEEAKEETKPVAMFVDAFPVRFSRRPLVLGEGMVRADGRITVGGVPGPGTFSALDLGGAVSPIDKLEIGVSTELTGNVPAPGGNSLITVIFSPQASYGDIPIYARYRYAASDVALAAVDLTVVMPSNTDFQLAVGLPLRILELFGLFTLDANLTIRYRNGDKYAAFSPNPSNNTAEFAFAGGSVTNITDNGYIEIGGGVGLANVGGGTDVKNVVEIPFFIGGGYTYEGKVLADIFAQFGFTPLMTANAPPGRDTFNTGDDWYITIGATVHTKSLFGPNKN